MVDIHLHTRFSFDSEEPPQNYMVRARELKQTALGFSEHYDYDAYLDGENISLADLNEYFKYVEKLRAENSDLQILCGVEFGYRADAVAKYRQVVSDFPFDYVINSVHTIKGRGDCYHDSFFDGRSLKESYTDYFKAVSESVSADFDFQIIGHIGYVSRYLSGAFSKIIYEDYADLLDSILTKIIKCGKCLEINTSAGKGGNTFLPDEDVIKRYKDLGGKMLSFGSDAHRSSEYMKNCRRLKEFLKDAGVEGLYYFKDRKPVYYKI